MQLPPIQLVARLRLSSAAPLDQLQRQAPFPVLLPLFVPLSQAVIQLQIQSLPLPTDYFGPNSRVLPPKWIIIVFE